MTTDDRTRPELFDFHAALAAGTLDNDEVGLATVVVDAFVKTVKAYRYYSAGHPQLEQFHAGFFTALTHFLAHWPVLPIDITESAFSVHGRVVHAASDLHASVPFLFYRDGVRLLRFYEEIEETEVTDLIAVILRGDRANQLEDDLVTLLWEQEFAHIDFQAVDYLPEGLPVAVPETVEAFREHLNTVSQFHSDEMSLWDALASGDTLSLQALVTDTDLYRLTPDELALLQDEVRAVVSPARMLEYGDLLLDMLALEQDVQLFRGLLAALRETLENLLAGEDFARAGALLVRARETTAFFTPSAWQVPLLREMPEAIVAARWFSLFEGYLRENPAWAEVLPVLSALPSSAAPWIVRLMGSLDSPRVRTALREVLVTMCAEHPGLLVPFLDDKNDQLVLDVARVLGHMGEESCLPAMTRAFQARGPAVRREIVEIVAQLVGTRPEAFLVKALRDGDVQVRCAAVAALGRRRTATAVDLLVKTVGDRRFVGKPLPEAAAYLDAVSRAGAVAALETLQRLLFALPWLGRGRYDALRPHVAQALATLNHPDAQKILAHGQAAKDRGIADACRRARAAKR
jgi:HEAT repeat protein